MIDHNLRADYSEQGPPTRVLVDRPAFALWLLGWVAVSVGFVGLPFAVVGLVAELFWSRDELGQPNIDAYVIGCVWTAGLIVWGVLVYWGSWHMSRRRRYWPALCAALLAMLPLPCFVAVPITLPIGVWALVVLLRSDVRAGFRGGPLIGRLGGYRE